MGFKNYVLTIMFTIIFCLTAFPTVLALSQHIETNYLPVIDKIQYVQTDATGDNKVLVWGKVNKVRECEFENISFYKKTRYGNELVASERLVPRKYSSAPKGSYDFGPYRVNMTEAELNSTSVIKFLHTCHPLYPTESIVYNTGKMN